MLLLIWITLTWDERLCQTVTPMIYSRLTLSVCHQQLSRSTTVTPQCEEWWRPDTQRVTVHFPWRLKGSGSSEDGLAGPQQRPAPGRTPQCLMTAENYPSSAASAHLCLCLAACLSPWSRRLPVNQVYDLALRFTETQKKKKKRRWKRGGNESLSPQLRLGKTETEPPWVWKCW